jgi:hypothetical protein
MSVWKFSQKITQPLFVYVLFGMIYGIIIAIPKNHWTGHFYATIPIAGILILEWIANYNPRQRTLNDFNKKTEDKR